MESTSTKDATLLVARLLAASLFLISGWGKLAGFSGTVGYMTQLGVPLPALATAVAIAAELGIGLAMVSGLFFAPLVALLAVYTIITAFIGHHYWTISDPAQAMVRMDTQIHFYKNFSIAGGLLALVAAGPGRYILGQPKTAPAKD